MTDPVPLIEFVHTCHVPQPVAPSRKYEGGQKVPESDLPADWLGGALHHGFCRRVEPTPAVSEPAATEATDDTPEPATPAKGKKTKPAKVEETADTPAATDTPTE